jgi:predicted AAA+ superfamily ATPase
MIERTKLLADVRQALRRSRVVALVGPRQCGKTTLARCLLAPDAINYFDLEDPRSLARLSEPMTALTPLEGMVVIDEVQRRPELFPILRVLVDRTPSRARFLVLGSASPELLRQSSETLAGRIEIVTMGGFTLLETGPAAVERHWLRGAFPPAFLARSEENSRVWRRQLMQTVLERDLPLLGISVPAPALGRLWSMLAHTHGNLWRASDPARSLGLSEPTVRRYLDLLTGLFMVRQLQPWHENLTKRQVKAPKVFVRDSGLLHELIGVGTLKDLLAHPKCGASWEGYAIEQVLSLCKPDESYFWATHQGAELDLLLFRSGRRFGVEVKRQDAPSITPSMRIAIEDLALDHLTVLYPGESAYTLSKQIKVLPLSLLASRPEMIYRRARA